MIRVSALRDQLSADLSEQSDDGLTAREQLMLVRKGVLAMEAEQTACLHEDLLPRLAAAGISIVSWEELDEERKEAARGYFRRNVLPVLTPLAVDPGHPFPFLSNLSLNLAIETKNPETGEVKFARVKMPPAIPRLLSLRAIVEGKKKVKADAGGVPPPREPRPGEPGRALPRPRDPRLLPLPDHARRRHRDPGGRGLRPPRHDRAGGPETAVRGGRPGRGDAEGAEADAQAPDAAARGVRLRHLRDRRDPREPPT